VSGPKEAVYDAAIAPLMTKIIELCKEHKINMAAQFALDPNDEGTTLFCTTVLSVDKDDAEGAVRIAKLREAMNPRPLFAAFTITSGSRGAK
jgi:hypothetical protein